MPDHETKNCVCETPRAERIALLNDALRKLQIGGRIAYTQGVTGLPGFELSTLLRAIAEYDGFDIDNDPHGERDFGDIVYCGADLLWKIDYYDATLTWGSSDPADPVVTIRVLTIMLAEEY